MHRHTNHDGRDGVGHGERRSRQDPSAVVQWTTTTGRPGSAHRTPSQERMGNPIMNDASGPDEEPDEPTTPNEPLRAPKRGAFPTPRSVIDQAEEYVPEQPTR